MIVEVRSYRIKPRPRAEFRSELWKNEPEAVVMPMLESYDVILCETSPVYVCDGPREGA